MANLAAPRLIALLGGTTSIGDCLVASRFLLRPGDLLEGPALERYEERFASRVGVRFAISFASGRVGLYALLKSLDIHAGDEVLLQVPTHVVIPNAIRHAGARPAYVDCELTSYNMDLAQAAERITDRTRVLLLQHTFGIPADLDKALELADRHGLVMIEDCVHALGASFDGRPVGSFGRAAFFSTEETKTISSTMGGMVVTDDPRLAGSLRRFQQTCAWPPAGVVRRYLVKLVAYHALTWPYIHRYTRAAYDGLGRRSPLPEATSEAETRGVWPPDVEQRLTNAQGAVALRQLDRLDDNLAHRRAVARAYREKLAASRVRLPTPPAKAEPAYVRYPMWVADRELVLRRAAKIAVLGKWFTSVLEEAASPAYGDYAPGTCPNAELAARHLVNLPTHQRVSARDVDEIVAAVTAAASAGNDE